MSTELMPTKAPTIRYHRGGRPARRKRKHNVILTALIVICMLLVLATALLLRRVPSSGEDSGEETENRTWSFIGVLQQQAEMTADEKLEAIWTSGDYPEELVELANKNEETIDYVYDYPQKKNETFSVDLSAEAEEDTVPLLMQWDERWGYAPYGSGLIGYTGCGPTCLSMVALYLTGDAQWTPLKVAQLAEENGYCVSGSGTDWSLMSEGCGLLGLSGEELPLSESGMKSELDAGRPIVAIMGPGDFTTSGHFIVIVGYDGDGFQVNDPNSRTNSERRWSYDTLSGQIRNLWSLSAL